MRGSCDGMNALRANIGWVFIFLYFLALPARSISDAMLIVMALWGIRRAWVNRTGLLSQPGVRVLLVLFATIWLPMLFSLPGAYSPERSFRAVSVYVLFLPVTYFVLTTLSIIGARRRLVIALCGLLLFWSLDVLVQLVTGVDLFGFPIDETRAKGIFYPETYLALFLACLFPIYALGLSQLAERFGLWIWVLLIPYTVAIVGSGSRAALLMLAVAGFCAFWWLWRTSGLRRYRSQLAIAIGGCLVATLIAAQHPMVHERIRLTGEGIGLSYEALNRASSERLDLWVTSLAIARDHWFNGVGLKGFRPAFEDYAKPGDQFMARGGVVYPHLSVLEVLVQTGIIGLGGYVLFCGFLLARLSAADTVALPWRLAVIAAIFPFNMDAIFQGTTWSGFYWILIAAALAAVGEKVRENFYPEAIGFQKNGKERG